MATTMEGAVENTVKFETWDTCSLRSNPFLVGTVERTALDFNSHEPLDDDMFLILQTAIEEPVLHRFVHTGVPEKGYVFVAWADEEEGRALIQESELNLISRCLGIGDTVKQKAEDAMVGTVVSVSDRYTLQPICSRTSNGTLRYKDAVYSRVPHIGQEEQCSTGCAHILPSGVRHEFPHGLLYDIPGEELKRADDYMEGDYILYQNWLGEVMDTVQDVVLRLDDGSLVVVDDPNELDIILGNGGGTMVALPEPDGYKKPDIVSWNHGIATIPPEKLSRGQYVVTNSKNLRNGRWLAGRPSAQPPHGLIMDVRTRIMDVRWLAPNVRSNITENSRPPATAMRPYDNLTTFTTPRQLRPKKDIILYDRGRRPVAASNSTQTFPVVEGLETQVGDHVRFRDTAGAAVKYREPFGESGCFRRLQRDETFGFDMNEFKIVCSRQNVTVRWQDQTITTEPSVSLVPYLAPDTEIIPGEIVALKEETQQVSSKDPFDEGTAFNEIQYLQGGFDLRLGKVGVVQSVDATERFAKIRWFSHAKVELLSQGSILKAGSTLGPISDTIEEVSLYEVMTYPALVRHRRELVLIPGAVEPTLESLNRQLPPPQRTTYVGACYLSYLHPWYLPSILEFLKGAIEPITRNYLESQVSKPSEITARSDDFVGEIVDLGLDGLITVRMGAMLECREIRIPLHWILMVIDGPDSADVDGSSTSTIGPEEDFFSDGSEAIEETVEYEGGQRLDEDSGDEMWSTDEDSDGGSGASEDNDEDVEMTDVEADEVPSIPSPTIQLDDTNSNNAVPSPSECASRILSLSTALVQSPLQFDVLEGLPPPDHAFISERAEMSLAALRRIRREHKILLSSLPHNVYVRAYESRLDLLRCMLIGPQNTPYEYAPFVIDLAIPANFPNAPPRAHFHSWTYGIGRVNPNLYEEGKICLSLLGTWHGKEEEQWSNKATILQVLVSLLGLVLVRNPFFNEAGFDSLERQGEFSTEARLYTEKVFVMARGFVKHALTRGIEGLDDILAWNYLPQPASRSSTIGTPDTNGTQEDLQRPDYLSTLLQRAQALIQHATSESPRKGSDALVDGAGEPSNEAFLTRLSRGAVVMLRKHVAALEGILNEAKGVKSKG